MFTAKDFRKEAWDRLNGYWGTMVLATLLNFLITGACGALSRYYIGAVAELILAGPLALGFAILSLNVARSVPSSVNTMFDGFKNFGSALALYLLNSLLIFLWSLLLIIPGIIKSFSYSMSYYILADNPQMSCNDARVTSMEMMKGNKWRLFCLWFSFIGWWLLSILTFGILFLWTIPYMQVATAAFYDDLKARNAQNIQNAYNGYTPAR